MEDVKMLYTKKGKELIYYLNQSRNPAMLLRWIRHFFLLLLPSKYFFSNKVCSEGTFLFPDFAEKIEQLRQYYKENTEGMDFVFFETFRSNERQHYLFDSGATKSQKYGMHYFGLAVDLTRILNGHHSWTCDYVTLRQGGNEIGLTNLYPFESCHFQFIPVSMQSDFRDFAFDSIGVIQDLLNCKMDKILGPITQGAVIFDYERLSLYFDECEKKLKQE